MLAIVKVDYSVEYENNPNKAIHCVYGLVDIRKDAHLKDVLKKCKTVGGGYSLINVLGDTHWKMINQQHEHTEPWVSKESIKKCAVFTYKKMTQRRTMISPRATFSLTVSLYSMSVSRIG